MEIRDKHYITPDFVKYRKIEESEKLNDNTKDKGENPNTKEKRENPDKKKQEKKDENNQEKGTIIDISI